MLLGFILVVGIVVLALGVLQITQVPDQTRSAEISHDDQMQTDMTNFGSAIDRATRTGGERGTGLRLGAEYPSWRFLLSPPPSVGSLETESGTLTLENIEVDGPENARLYREAVASFDTERVVFEPNYHEYQSGATIQYEHGVVASSFDRGDDVLRSQPNRLFTGESIRLPVVSGDLSLSRDSVSVEARATGTAAQSVPVTSNGDGPIRFTLPSDVDPAVWERALPDAATVQTNESGDVTVELEERDDPYELYLGGVALNDRQTEDAAYLVNVTSQAVDPNERFTVEARDRFDNPVPGAPLNLTGCNLSDTTTDDDGQATLRCNQVTESVIVRLDDAAREELTEYDRYEWVQFNTGGDVSGTTPFVESDPIELTEREFQGDPENKNRTRLRIDYTAVADLFFDPESGEEPAELESAALEVYERSSVLTDAELGEIVTATTQPLSGQTDNSTWVTPWLDPGEYAVQIRVKNTDGQTAVAYTNETVGVPSLSADPGPDRTVDVGEPIAFDGSNSTGDIIAYDWDFGDGTTATGVTPEHTYTESGTYTVTLTVTGADGETVTNTATVQVVDPAGTISGTVTDTAGTPLEGVAIRVLDAADTDGTPVTETTTDANGTYLVDVDGDATYTVVADGSDLGFSTESATVPVPAGEGVVQDFELTEIESAIEGTVTDEADNPLSGVTIELRDPETDVLLNTVSTDENGQYQLPVEGDRSYTVIANGTELGFSTETALDVSVPIGETVTQDFTLLPSDGSISGTVTDSAGNPVEGAEISVTDAETGTVVETMLTDGDGTYTVTVAGDREYTVRADGSGVGLSIEQQTVQVGPGETVENVDFTLVASDGSIAGQVVNEGGVPIQGVTVRIIDPDTDTTLQSLTTDSQGRYSASVPGDRTYDVEADGTAVQYSTERQSVTLGAGEDRTDVDFELDPIGRAADVVFVEGSQLSFGQANAQYGFALRNDGTSPAVIERVSIPRVDNRDPASAIGRAQGGNNPVFRPTFTVAAGDGITSTPAAGSLDGNQRILIGGPSVPLTTSADIAVGETVRFTVGDFKTTTTGFQRQNMVGASVVLSVTFEDGSQRTIRIVP